MVLGDSQTFGTGVSENELFSKHIETFINSKDVDFPKIITVINAGMPGTGTYDQLIYLEREGVKYKPDLVVIAFYINDYDDNVNKYYTFNSITYDKKRNVLTTSGLQYYKYEENFSRYLVRNVFNSIPFYDYLSTHSNLLNFLKQRIHKLIKKDYLNTNNEIVSFFEKNNITSINWFDKDMNNKEHLSSKKGFTHLASVIITKSLMSRVLNFTAQHHIDFLLVIIPQKGEVINSIPKRKYLFMGQDTKRVNTLNLANHFANIEKNNLSYLFYPEDIHLSPTGHLAAGYFTSLHIMDLFFKDRQFNKEKIKNIFQQLMEPARNHLIKRLNSIKDYPKIHFYKALVLASENLKKNIAEIVLELEHALKLYNKKTKIPPNDLFFYLGKYKRIMGKVDEAIHYLQQAEASSGSNVDVIKSELGLCWLIKKDFKKAEKLFIESRVLNPDKSASYFGLGLIYLEKGSYSKAIKYLKKANEIKPKDPVIFKALNYAVIKENNL